MKTIGFIPQELQLVINKCSLLITIICFFVFSCTCTNKHKETNCVVYDKLSKKKVYVFVEKMPEYKGGDNAFTSDFLKVFHYKFQANENIQTKLQIQFVVDKKGHLVNPRIYNKKTEQLTSFEKKGLEAINLMQNWKAGKCRDKNVDVIITRVIHVDFR